MILVTRSLPIGVHSEAPTQEPGNTQYYEPVFTVPALKGINLTVDKHGKNAIFLAQQVAYSPLNLTNHVRRINLQILLGNQPGLWGALLDLFLVLQSKALSLRQLLLNRSRAVLGSELYQFLQDRLRVGLSNDCTCPIGLHSVLAKGLSGPLKLISKLETDPGDLQDPLSAARDHLEYGQVSAAREVLEAAIAAEPLQPELHHELLAIYRSTRDSEGFVSMHQSIAADDNPVPEDWNELATFFAS